MLLFSKFHHASRLLSPVETPFNAGPQLGQQVQTPAAPSLLPSRFGPHHTLHSGTQVIQITQAVRSAKDQVRLWV